MKRVYYITKTNDLFTMNDIERAFLLVTGKKRKEHEKDYILFLDNLFKKKKIVEYKTLSTEELIEMGGHRFLAIMQYRSEHNCTFGDARNAVDIIEGIIDTRKGHGDK